jgi:hypothetical protein
MTVNNCGDRERWDPLFAWAYTCCWVVALIYAWSGGNKMPLWLKVAVWALLTLTTPGGSDLLLIRRYWRTDGSKTT